MPYCQAELQSAMIPDQGHSAALPPSVPHGTMTRITITAEPISFESQDKNKSE